MGLGIRETEDVWTESVGLSGGIVVCVLRTEYEYDREAGTTSDRRLSCRRYNKRRF